MQPWNGLSTMGEDECFRAAKDVFPQLRGSGGRLPSYLYVPSRSIRLEHEFQLARMGNDPYIRGLGKSVKGDNGAWNEQATAAARAKTQVQAAGP